MTLLAAFQSLLYRYRGQTGFCVGAPVATRAREEVQGLVGCLVNSLALRRVRVRGNHFPRTAAGVRLRARGVRESGRQLGTSGAEVQPDRDPAARLCSRCCWWSITPLSTGGGPRHGDVRRNTSATRARPFDLVLLVDSARREAAFEYNTDIFEAATIERMSVHLRELLGGIAARPDCRVGEVPVFPEAERPMVSEVRRDERCLQHMFEAQVRRTPDAPAVAGESRSVTYAQLDSAANRVAAMLREHGAATESLVAICASPSPAGAGMLGVLKAGAAFVPLDPGYPQERLAFMLRDCARPAADGKGAGYSGRLPGSGASVGPGRVAGGTPRPSPRTFAGQPGVRNVYLRFERVAEGRNDRASRYREPGALAPGDVPPRRLRCGPAGHFPEFRSVGLGDLRPAIRRGGGSDSGGWNRGPAVNRLIRRHRVTVIQGVPSLLRSLLEQGALAGCESLRHVFSGGEALDNRLAEELIRATGAAVHQLYGCTETAIDATCLAYARPGQFDAPPIGKAIANVRAMLLSDVLQPLPVGVPGELYVGGAALARGYLNQPDLTAARFVREPDSGKRIYRTGDLARLRADGYLELLGRADRQIKIRGVRIEPAEIEAPLRAHEAVRNAVAGTHQVRGEACLAAWVQVRPGFTLTADEAIAHLSRRLPRFLIPSHWAFLDALPLTPDGKVDFHALPDPELRAPGGAPGSAVPLTPIEQRIAATWEDLLGIQGAGVADNFFDLGGHSLLAARLAFRLKVPLSTILARPTIAELAREMAGEG